MADDADHATFDKIFGDDWRGTQVGIVILGEQFEGDFLAVDLDLLAVGGVDGELRRVGHAPADAYRSFDRARQRAGEADVRHAGFGGRGGNGMIANGSQEESGK